MRGGGEDVLSSLSLRVGAGGDSCVRGCRAWLWGSKEICPFLVQRVEPWLQRALGVAVREERGRAVGVVCKCAMSLVN